MCNLNEYELFHWDTSVLDFLNFKYLKLSPIALGSTIKTLKSIANYESLVLYFTKNLESLATFLLDYFSP
jgi:hypothetical protein